MAPPKKAESGKVKKVGGKKAKASGWTIFSAEQRPVLKAENPDITFGQMGKLLGEKWSSLSDAQKKVFINHPKINMS